MEKGIITLAMLVRADDFLTLLTVVRKEIRSIEEKPPKLQSYLIHLNVIKLIAP